MAMEAETAIAADSETPGFAQTALAQLINAGENAAAFNEQADGGLDDQAKWLRASTDIKQVWEESLPLRDACAYAKIPPSWRTADLETRG